MKSNRRSFIKKAAVGAAGLGLAASLPEYLRSQPNRSDLFFKIAISQFFLASEFWTKKLDPLDFPAKVKNDFGITGLDYCSMFFADKAKNTQYLQDLKKRSADAGTYNLRIMVDVMGGTPLGDLNEAARIKTVEAHYPWLDAAAILGCPMIRVNVEGEGKPEDVAKASGDSFGRLIEYGRIQKVEVIVENHVGISLNGASDRSYSSPLLVSL